MFRSCRYLSISSSRILASGTCGTNSVSSAKAKDETLQSLFMLKPC
jgi:hypothetical protein